jgi:glucokinase
MDVHSLMGWREMQPAEKNRLAVGIDIGGTYVKSGLVDRDGRVLHKEQRPVRKATPQEFYDLFTELVNFWRGETTAELIGIGVGVPGFINHKTGVLDQSPNLHALDGMRIFAELEQRAALPVAVDNDANAAAWGEYWAGEGKGAELMILLTLGSGVGGGIVWNGAVWHGACGYAGEPGHMIIHPDGEHCGCGHFGCIESVFSATAFIRKTQAAIAAGRATSLAAVTEPLKGKHVLDAAAAGDAVAREIVDSGSRSLGMSIGNLLNLLNPDQIVLGGGIIAAADYLMPKILAGVAESAIAGALASCRIRPSHLGNDAGLIGAAGLAWAKK